MNKSEDYLSRERTEKMKNKDKSIKSTMKSWIMLSEKELDDTQVYMEEQKAAKKALDNGSNVNSMDSELITDEARSEENSISEESELYESELYSDRAGLYSDIKQTEQEVQSENVSRLSRDQEIEQLVKEVGQEVVSEEEELVPRRRRKRHKDKKARGEEKGDGFKNTEPIDKASYTEGLGDLKKKNTPEEESDLEKAERVKRADVPEKTENIERVDNPESVDKTQKSGGMTKIVTGAVGVLLVIIIGALGYQNQALERQNQKLKTEISSLEKAKKQAEKDSEEQALQTKNEDGVVANTDKMFDSVKVGDKEYKLLCKVSDFTKDGWKLEALRTENATLVPGGKLEKDAFLTNTDGKKIGVIIRNMSDKNQKVSDCIVTKLSFSKEMFDEQITLPKSLGFASTEKDLKAAGFKKDADGTYYYTSKKVKDDSIKMTMADGETISDITIERAVDESAVATENSNSTSNSSTAGTTETGSGNSTNSMNSTDNVNSTTEMN